MSRVRPRLSQISRPHPIIPHPSLLINKYEPTVLKSFVANALTQRRFLSGPSYSNPPNSMRNFTNFAVAKLLVIFFFSLLTVAIARKRDFQVAEFNTLNATIGGRLQSATPLALPCFSNYDGKSVTPDPQACSVAQANYDTWTYRSLRYGNTMAVSCTFNSSCLLISHFSRAPGKHVSLVMKVVY